MRPNKDRKIYTPKVKSQLRTGFKDGLKFNLRNFVVVLQRQNLKYLKYRAAIFASILLLISTYLTGLSTGISSSKSYAEFVFTDSTSLVKESSNLLKVAPVVGTGQLPLKIDEDNLFGMPIEQLEKVFAKKQAEMTEAMYDARAEKIKAYLQEYNSPFAEYSPVIARQPHWQLILAISFAESSWGKNCVNNNCSNIGVKPGHELWHEYKNYGEWIVDFNKLLERRYKDWTLDDMCGVYVKPCNKNWLLATRQVLQELQDKSIN